jgi:membrane-associated phospholipid phosphatase
MEQWLQSLVPWGTQVIVWVQAASPAWLTELAKFFTYLGYSDFFFVLLPLVYWCIHKRIGAALGGLLLLSVWLNDAIKYLFNIPRPAGPGIRVPMPETNPSFPSGHAQSAITNWGYLAVRFQNRIVRVVAVVLILGISLSRIVLGVHFPEDILGGWIIGLILLVVYAWAEPKVSRWVAGRSMALQVALAIAFPLLLIFLHPPDTQGRYPTDVAIITMGALAGLGAGLILEQKWVRFAVEGAWWRRGLRLVVGLVVVALFYEGLALVIPAGLAYGLEALLSFLHYLLVGWVVAFLCPWLFVRLRLAESEGAPLPTR